MAATALTIPKLAEKLNDKAYASLLPAHVPLRKFQRTTLGAVQSNPDILKCTPQSVMSACQKAAQDGLLLDNREAAIVVFRSKVNNKWVQNAQYMPMVSGVLKKLRNSGQLSTIAAEIVYEYDEFSYNPGTGELIHDPDWFGDRGDAVGVYAVAVLKDGGRQIEIMNRDQLEAVRKVSKAGKDDKGNPAGIWKQWPEEMWRKTVLRRIAKYLPSSSDLDQMWDNDNDNFDLDDEAGLETDVQPASTEDINADLGAETEAKEVEGEIVNDAPTNDGPGPDDYEGDPI